MHFKSLAREKSCSWDRIREVGLVNRLHKTGRWGEVENTLDKQDSGGRPIEPRGILGGLAQRLQDGVRATIVALGQSHAQRLAAIIDSSNDAIISKDLDGIIATWNDAAERIFGYTADEMIGRPIMTLIPVERQDEEETILARIRQGERIDHYETVRQRKDGRRIEISLSVSPIRDAAGTVVGASKIVHDITTRKQIERALAKRMDEQAALFEFTDRLFRAASVEDIHEAGLDAIMRALGCDRASILLFDDTGIMKFVTWRGLSDGYRVAVERPLALDA